MPSVTNQSPEKRGFDWPAIIRTLLVQVLVLLALSGAVVRYVSWSSDKAWAEFNAATGPSAPHATPQSATPLQAVKDRAPCARRLRETG
jgi:hypothetical protein